MRYAVTGASGWLGMATLEWLADRGEIGQVTAYASRARTLVLRDGTRLEARPLAALAEDDLRGTTLLHFAYRTREQAAEVGEATYVRDNVAITATVCAAMERTPPAAMLLASSGAVHSRGAGLGENPYGMLKRLDELTFSALCAQVGTRLVTARIFNVSGPHMGKPEAYALGSLVLAALAGRPLEVRAARPVRRSFVGIADLVAVALAELGEPGGAPQAIFDTAGSETVEVGELADRVRRVLGREDLPIERPAIDPAMPADDYVGDGRVLAELAARHGIGLTPLDDQIRRSAVDLRLLVSG